MVAASFGFCIGLYNDCDCCKCSMFVPWLGICWEMGATTLIALGVIREGIGVNGRCCGGHFGNGSEISSSPLLGLLVLLTL